MSSKHEFFRYVSKKESSFDKNTIFSLYEATHPRSTMILKSKKTQTPLAALVLLTADSGCRRILTARPPPSGKDQPHFQGMLDMPDQPFSLAIVNLTSDTINFNILHTPEYKVDKVDPGPAFGINQVNELHAGQAYVVKSDQRVNRQMVLRGLTKNTPQGEAKITVKDSESKTDSPQGLYFYLSVVGKANSAELQRLFSEGSAWTAAPYYIVKEKCPVYQTNGNPYPFFCGTGSSRGHGTSSAFGTRSAFDLQAYDSRDLSSNSEDSNVCGYPLDFPTNDYRSLSSNNEMHIDSGVHFGLDSTPVLQNMNAQETTNNASDDSAFGFGSVFGNSGSGSNTAAAAFRGPSSRQPSESAFGFGSFFGNSGSGSNTAAAFGGPSQNQTSIAAFSLSSGHEEEEADEADDSMCFLFDDDGTSAPKSQSSKQDMFQVDVGTSQAGRLDYGETVTVNSSRTGYEYLYDYPSDPTVLCMSICSKMDFYTLNFKSLAEQELVNTVTHEKEQLLNTMPRFKSEVCCIDLESEPDIVVVQCGHQCVNHKHKESLAKQGRCPICRGPIMCMINVDSL